MLTRFDIMNWGLPKQIINDRDRKFISDFWNTFFKSLEIKLLYSTAYHPQTDDQSKRINQTVEIAFKYHLVTLNDLKVWSDVLSAIQRGFNNSVFATDRIFNECVYGFILITSFSFLQFGSVFSSMKWTRQEIFDVIAFFQLVSKFHYDKKHQSIQLAEKSWALLRFHRKYNISFIKQLDKKLFQQFVGPFKIFQKIDNLAYKLEIFHHWRIHLVFIIVQLKSVFVFESDFYERQKIRLFFVHVDEDTNLVKNFVMKKIIDTRQSTREKEYLIRWKKYGSEKNAWRNFFEMKNVLNLIRKYEEKTIMTDFIFRRFRVRKINTIVIRIDAIFVSVRKRDRPKKTPQ